MNSIPVHRVGLLLPLVSTLLGNTNAFVPFLGHHQPISRTVTTRVWASTQEEGATATSTKPKVQELGLLTFDLDDTLYPIEPVVKADNGTLVITLVYFGRCACATFFD